MRKKLIIISIIILVAAGIASVYYLTGKKDAPAASNQAGSTPSENLLDGEKAAQPIQASPTEDVSEENTADLQIKDQKDKASTINDTGNDSSGSSDKAETDTLSPKTDQGGMKIVDKLVSWGFQKADGRKIDTIIIHSTYDAVGKDPFSLSGVLQEYKDYGVSPHYIIDRKGTVYRLVADNNIAYHAGESKMPDGRTNVNSFSLGIEIITSKYAKPTDEQYASLKNLLSYLRGKYSVKYVLGHKDIAPGRKDDPWNFDWGKIK